MARSYRRNISKRKSSKRTKSKSKYSWIKRKGKLGGPGFLSKSRKTQKRLIDKCKRRYGKRSCLGSVMVLERSSILKKKYGDTLKSLHRYTLKE